ncbi:sensor histidine kinase [Humibacter ginsenosidimutans]|uniref:ATP-binding protein n=1 Tax=Humibacter ginsenosidimutans TaxID=2599293 RepID=A0A5B8M8M1_9MICO|nr:ATP-binding protein [Humibacter ginsenosidimutans]QDZ16404.1 ATP-binding protein [Humibacter ginsenosidimutans]
MASADLGAAPGPRPVATANPLTRARVERLAARAVAGFSWVFGLQVIPEIIVQSRHLGTVYTVTVAAVLFASLAWLGVASIVGRTVRSAAITFCVGYLVALAFWDGGITDTTYFDDTRPWLWFLLTVATACAAIAMPFVWAAVYTILAPALYAVVLVLTSGAVAEKIAVLDALYAVIFASILLAIVTMLRQAATQVDVSQAAALERYEVAVRAHALEAERVEVDAIVHDSVLTTLLSAAHARTPEAMAIASSMARDALGHLDSSAPLANPGRSLDAIPVDRLRDRIISAARSFTVPFSIVPRATVDALIPVSVAEALYSATVQAMVNSAQHAGGVLVRRSLRVEATDGGGVVVVVSDDGSGFDIASIPPERLGLEVSIRERVALAGGEASIDSKPGRGTTVRLSWLPDDEADQQ